MVLKAVSLSWVATWWFHCCLKPCKIFNAEFMKHKLLMAQILSLLLNCLRNNRIIFDLITFFKWGYYSYIIVYYFSQVSSERIFMSKAVSQESWHPDLGLLLILFQVAILLLKSSILASRSINTMIRSFIDEKSDLSLWRKQSRALCVSVENWEIVIHVTSFQPSLNSMSRSK